MFGRWAQGNLHGFAAQYNPKSMQYETHSRCDPAYPSLIFYFWNNLRRIGIIGSSFVKFLP
jgi:hypothetical protein